VDSFIGGSMVSFDIFDTLITRNTYTPKGIFDIIQEKIYTMDKTESFGIDLSHNFAECRVLAEQDAWRICRQRNSEEITLLEIYHSFRRMTGISDELMDQLMLMEEQTEIENAVPITDNIRLLEKHLENGEDVILISDMYLPAAVIRRMLFKVKPILASLELYVSSEIRKRKATGSLYVFIKRKKNILYKDWIHYGDNPKSDIESALLWGIQAILLSSHSEIAEIASRFSESLNVDEQLFLGTIKNLHIEEHLSPNQLIGAFWGGGFLYSYVAWVIQYSLAHSYHILYFISRDGYILKKIADIIIAENHYEIITKYLFGSRKAWRESNVEKVQLLREYFEQEVDFKEGKFAFVDLQGTGTSILKVKTNLEKYFESQQLNVFFFQLFSCPDISGCNFITYSYLSSTDLIEMFARAPHGMVEGYKKQGSRIVPILANVKKEVWEQHGLPDYFAGVWMFAKQYAVNLKKNGRTGISQHISVFLEKEFERYLNKNELQFIGEIPHNSTDDERFVMAPKISRKNLFDIFMWRTTEPLSEYYQGGDLRLSLRRLGEKEQRYVKKLEKNYYRWTGRFIHKIKHIFTAKSNFDKNRFIIYAAGNKGKETVAKITYLTNGKVVGWTDANYSKYKKMGYPVMPLRDCVKKDYDKLIIAIDNKLFCMDIKEYLLELGIEASKILFYEDFCQLFKENSIL